MKNRLHYIDVYKGFLMLMVIYGHIAYAIWKYADSSTNYIYSIVQYIASTYMAPYYMAAFFVASGFCTNMEKSVKEHLITGIRSLLLPGILVELFMSLTHPQDFVLKNYLRSLMTNPCGWFILAMFWARLIYLFVWRIKNQYIRISLLFLLMHVGAFLIGNKYFEWWSIWHAMVMVIFFEVGIWLRNNQKILDDNRLFFLPVLFYVSVFICHYLGCGTPAFCAIQSFDWKITSVYLFLAITGSIALFFVCKKIKQNAVIEWVGRNSLVFYLTHYTFFILFIPLLRNPIIRNEGSSLVSVCIVLFLFGGASLWSAAWTWIFSHNYLKWVLGK